MGRIGRTLAVKSLTRFFVATVIVLAACLPLMYLLMERYYKEDLDELIIFRYDDFVKHKLPAFSTNDIPVWNGYNEDMLILPYREGLKIGEVSQEEHYNRAEGHEIYYRVYYGEVLIEGHPYVFMSRIPMIESKDLWKTLSAQYGVLFIVLLLSLSVLYYYMSKRLWRPFYTTLGAISRFDLGQGVVPAMGTSDTVEFERLNRILEELLSGNIRVYNDQKKFIENASHELQTPLAVFLSQLDMLLQSPDLTDRQSRTIQMLYSVASRMTRLNKNLLLLAKIDNSQFRQREDLDFIQLLNAQLEYLRPMAEDNGLSMTVQTDNSLIINANKTLVESLVNNIVVNAINHNVQNGAILVSVCGTRFTVTNTGEGTALDPEVIFRRFNKSTDGRKGNGLGLSIVAQIVRLHKWGIAYEYTDSGHSFIVNFAAKTAAPLSHPPDMNNDTI